MRRTTHRNLLVVLTLLILSMIQPSRPYAESNMEADEHIERFASTVGIAVELYLDGVFIDSIGILFIFPELYKMRMGSFNFDLSQKSPKGVICLQDFKIEKIYKVHPRKMAISGKTDLGYDYMANYSIINDRLDFNLVIEGRGRVEIKNLGENGMRIKNKYLKHIKLGWINP